MVSWGGQGGQGGQGVKGSGGVRQEFLLFFEEKQHLFSPLTPSSKATRVPEEGRGGHVVMGARGREGRGVLEGEEEGSVVWGVCWRSIWSTVSPKKPPIPLFPCGCLRGGVGPRESSVGLRSKPEGPCFLVNLENLSHSLPYPPSSFLPRELLPQLFQRESIPLAKTSHVRAIFTI